MERERVYTKPNLSLIMGELIAKQGVAEAVSIEFVDDNVIEIDFSDPEDIVA